MSQHNSRPESLVISSGDENEINQVLSGIDPLSDDDTSSDLSIQIIAVPSPQGVIFPSHDVQELSPEHLYSEDSADGIQLDDPDEI